MGPARPPHGIRRRLDEAPLGCDDYAYDEYTEDDAVSLLEENARLRKLVVSLSELVLRKVVAK